MQFIKQNLNLKAHPFLHILIYYKRFFILRYSFFEHLKNIHREYVQKCQNHKNSLKMDSEESHFNVSVGSDGQSHKTVSTTTTFLKRKNQSGIEPRSFRLPT